MKLLITETAERVWLRVRGEDTETFLQGQLSNDVRALRADKGQLTSLNSPKGRMLAIFQLLRSDDGILLEVHREIAETSLARLKMFVLRAKLTLETATDIDALALIGADAPVIMQKFKLPVPEQPQDCLRDDARGLIVLRRLGELPRYSVVGPHPAIEDLRAAIPAAMFEPEGRLWRHADIEAGVPVVLPETRDHFVPQMANLDLLGGISFKKGCYTGQEIVARVHYLGQLKRRLFVAQMEGPAPAPGSSVQIDGEEQAVGEIVDAVTRGQRARASVVLQLSSRDAALHVGGHRLTLISGPAA